MKYTLQKLEELVVKIKLNTDWREPELLNVLKQLDYTIKYLELKIKQNERR